MTVAQLPRLITDCKGHLLPGHNIKPHPRNQFAVASLHQQFHWPSAVTGSAGQPVPLPAAVDDNNINRWHIAIHTQIHRHTFTHIHTNRWPPSRLPPRDPQSPETAQSSHDFQLVYYKASRHSRVGVKAERLSQPELTSERQSEREWRHWKRACAYFYKKALDARAKRGSSPTAERERERDQNEKWWSTLIKLSIIIVHYL